MSDKGSKIGNIGIVGLLTVAFVVMKLAEVGAVVHWSWWWVLSPLWIAFVLIVVLSVIAAVVR